MKPKCNICNKKAISFIKGKWLCSKCWNLEIQEHMKKCQSKISPYCEKRIESGKEKYISGKVCCEWCYIKEKKKAKQLTIRINQKAQKPITNQRLLTSW